MELAARPHIHSHVGDVPGPGAEPLLEEPGLCPAAPQLLDRGVEHAIDGQNVFGLGTRVRHSSSRCDPLEMVSSSATSRTAIGKEYGAIAAATHGGYGDEQLVWRARQAYRGAASTGAKGGWRRAPVTPLRRSCTTRLGSGRTRAMRRTPSVRSMERCSSSRTPPTSAASYRWSARSSARWRQTRSSRINAAAFSPIMSVAALVLPLTGVGMIEASATRRPRRRREGHAGPGAVGICHPA